VVVKLHWLPRQANCFFQRILLRGNAYKFKVSFGLIEDNFSVLFTVTSAIGGVSALKVPCGLVLMYSNR